MAYLVLARKWRPQIFTELIGQEHVSQTLANAIRSGRIHHAFLFTGARGVGKTSAARILAKALNCEEGLSEQPCGSCSSCLEITSGQGMDVIEIDGASNTGVDDVRELRENIRYLPSRARFKIFIIDEVHMLSTSAFNALLKTLEEPPEHAKFIFATTEPQKIPITILSRCQRFDFRKIPLAKVKARLQEISTAEKLSISDQSLTLIARQGEGSMRDALSTFDQVLAFSGENVEDDAVRTLLGMVDRRLIVETAEAVLQRDSRRALESAHRIDDLGVAMKTFNQDLLEMFRCMVICKVVDQPAELLDLVEEELKTVKTLAEGTSLEDLQRIVTLLIKNKAELAQSNSHLLTMEMALVRLATLAQSQDLVKLINHIESLEKRLSMNASASPTKGIKPAGTSPPKKPEAPVAAKTDIKGWQGLVDTVRNNRPMLGSVLEHGRPLKLEPPTLEIGYPKGSFMISQLDEEDIRVDLEALASNYFEQPVKIKISSLESHEEDIPKSLVQSRQDKETDRMRRLREDALEHPAVKAVQEVFNGKIKKIIPIDKGFV